MPLVNPSDLPVNELLFAPLLGCRSQKPIGSRHAPRSAAMASRPQEAAMPLMEQAIAGFSARTVAVHIRWLMVFRFSWHRRCACHARPLPDRHHSRPLPRSV